MKFLFLILLSGFIFQPLSNAETKQDFVRRIEKALFHPDIEQRKAELNKMLYTQGADEKILKMNQEMVIPMLAEMKSPKVTLLPLPNGHKDFYVMDGVKYTSNNPHLGFLSLELPGNSTKFPYGKVKDNYVLTSMASERVSNLVDKAFGVFVLATAHKGPGNFDGICNFKMSDGSLKEFRVDSEKKCLCNCSISGDCIMQDQRSF